MRAGGVPPSRLPPKYGKAMTYKGGRYKHGMRHTRVYNIWKHMTQRCRNIRHHRYEYYGGRGITVCQEWLEFANFYRDMGDPPFKYSIDRINNNLGYYKENCRWASHQEQMSNTRKNRYLTFCNQTKTLSGWARVLNVTCEKLRKRLSRGWTIEETLSN